MQTLLQAGSRGSGEVKIFILKGIKTNFGWQVVASSVVDIDPDDGVANASLSFEQFDVIIPKQRLETFDIAIMTERGPFTNDVGNFMECSFHDKQMIGKFGLFPNCQTPHPNKDPKDQFGFGVTLKSKSPPTHHHPP